MRDRDIRSALKLRLRQEHGNESDTLLLDELGLCTGNARVDVAVVNGAINGFEIKSERDTLQRLPHQVEIYSRTLDTVTIVVGGNHLENVLNLVPEWWGVERAYYGDGDSILFEPLRPALKNTSVDAYSLVQLLWRDEALKILTQLNLEKGMLSKPRKAIWKKLAESNSVAELNEFVRRELKARINWRSDAQPSLNGD